jgi:excisionase family DNA binding protein
MPKTKSDAAPAVVTTLPAFGLLSPTDAAEALGVGRTKFMKLVRSGRVRVRMLDGRIRVPVEALEEFRNALPDGYEKGIAPAKAGGAS